MGRIRTIKPEFFSSEDICSLSAFARLLYIALWCESDREGRLEWKPNTFKLRYFPGDSLDMAALCDELLQRNLVVLYGDGFACIPKFSTHQHVNNREAESKLPPPLEVDACPTRDSRVTHAQGGKERKGKEGVVPNGTVASNALPTPPATGQSLPTAALLTEKTPASVVPWVVGLYHEVLPELPPVRLMSDKRKKAICRLWRWPFENRRPGENRPRATTAAEAQEWLRTYFARVRENDFLMGHGGRSSGHEGWRCDLDFLLSEKGMKQVIEKTGSSA